MVRDLAHDSGKKAELSIAGGETEIDRRILEEIKVPLMHIVRNCMDYGIETPDLRIQKGKDPCGIIKIDVRPKDSRNVEIMITDDGAGIDRDKVRNAAVKSGLLSPEASEKIPDDKISDLIFSSGVSTSSIITDLSGRGIGLAIVQEKTEKLGGTVSVESVQGKGTKFVLVLPLMQATFRGVMVTAGERIL
jgi:two-component system chemotaxis sensor kinase CheA